MKSEGCDNIKEDQQRVNFVQINYLNWPYDKANTVHDLHNNLQFM